MKMEEKTLNRDIYFCEEITEESTKELIKSIIDVNAFDDQQEKLLVSYQRNPIRLYMTTGGGSAYHTIALFDHIRASRTPVHIYISGYCCSGGFYMLGAAEKVFAYEHTSLMYHQLSSEMYYSYLEKQKQIVKNREELQKILDALVLDNTKITKEKLKEINEKQIDWWMDTTEAKKLGVIDEIIK